MFVFVHILASIYYFLNDNHSDWDEIESHYDFDLYFSDGQGHQTLYQILMTACISSFENFYSVTSPIFIYF